MMILVELFISFFQIGLFSFGGGYASIPLIFQQVTVVHTWMSELQLNDLITISQMTPGPIAINAATFIGIEMGGFWGSVVATCAVILPSIILVSILARFYMKYKDMLWLQDILAFLRPAVVALIASAGVSIMISAFFNEGIISFDTFLFYRLLFFFGALILIRKKNNPVLVMFLCGICEVIITLI